MNASNGAVEPGIGAHRALHLVPSPPESEKDETWPWPDGAVPAAPGGLDPSRAETDAAPADGLPLIELPTPQPLTPQGDAALEVATLRLRRELVEMQEEVAALQEMLQELPSIFERKFQQRLRKVVDQQRLLEANNTSLRRRLLALAPGGEAEALPLRPHGLLPPSVRTALKLRQQEAIEAPLVSGAEPTTGGSADPTHR